MFGKTTVSSIFEMNVLQLSILVPTKVTNVLIVQQKVQSQMMQQALAQTKSLDFSAQCRCPFRIHCTLETAVMLL